MVTKLVELREKIQAKQDELSKIFEAKPERDFSDTEVDEIRQRNSELTDLGKEFEKQREIDGIASKVRQAHADRNAPTQEMRHPTVHDPSGAGQEGGRIIPVKRLSDWVIENDGYLATKGKAKHSGEWVVEAKEGTLQDYKTLLTTTTGYPPATNRGNIMIMSAQRRPTIADLIPQDATNESAIIYMEETTFTNNAAPVAEAGTKPESALAYTQRTVPVEVIATWIPATNQQLEDVAGMRNLIDNRLTLMLALTEENQLLNGTGTSPQLTGFLNKVGIQNQTKAAGEPIPDAVYKAFTKVRNTGMADPTGVVFHPDDWTRVRLLRTADGVYIWGAPSEAGPERIWGVQVIQTTAIAANTALTGDFQLYSHISRRQGIRIDVADQHGTYFVENKQAIRIEERLSLEIYRAAAFCTITDLNVA